MAPGPGRIVVCFDGTDRSLERHPSRPTNVSRLDENFISVSTPAGTAQNPYMIGGIGSNHAHAITAGFDSATGRGLGKAIRDAYAHVCKRYNTPDDEIILIGFSRGAFIARCLADLICGVGLLQSKHLRAEGKRLYKAWKTGRKPTATLSKGTSSFPLQYDSDPTSISPMLVPADEYLDIREEFDDMHENGHDENGNDKKNDSATDWAEDYLTKICQNSSIMRCHIPIRACFLFDTVASIGLRALAQKPPKRLAFVDSGWIDGIKHGFQALALHEERKGYLPLVWRSPEQGISHRNLCQCWFTGYHGDIGGGRSYEALAQISMIWMIAKIMKFVHLKHDLDGVANLLWDREESLSFRWALSSPPTKVQRTSNFFRRLASLGQNKSSEDSLQVNGAPNGAPVIVLRNPLKSFAKAFGGAYRKPRRQFWTQYELEEVDLNVDSTDQSNEVVHWTVRAVMEPASAPLPPHLQPARLLNPGSCHCDGANHQRAWQISMDAPDSGLSAGMYKLCESAIVDESVWEARLLQKWLDFELEHLLEVEREDSDWEPKTFINQIRGEIANAISRTVTIQAQAQAGARRAD